MLLAGESSPSSAGGSVGSDVGDSVGLGLGIPGSDGWSPSGASSAGGTVPPCSPSSGKSVTVGHGVVGSGVGTGCSGSSASSKSVSLESEEFPPSTISSPRVVRPPPDRLDPETDSIPVISTRASANEATAAAPTIRMRALVLRLASESVAGSATSAASGGRTEPSGRHVASAVSCSSRVSGGSGSAPVSASSGSAPVSASSGSSRVSAVTSGSSLSTARGSSTVSTAGPLVAGAMVRTLDLAANCRVRSSDRT